MRDHQTTLRSERPSERFDPAAAARIVVPVVKAALAAADLDAGHVLKETEGLVREHVPPRDDVNRRKARRIAAALSRDARRQLLGFGEELRSDGEGGLHRVHSTARVLGSCVAATRVVRCRHRQQAAQHASALFVLTH